MLKRCAWDKLDSWFKSGHTSILIYGARQIGKTTTITNYLKKNKIAFLIINLLNDVHARIAFNTSKNAKQLLLRLSSLAKEKIVPGKTIIFIDEIQEVKDARTAIKLLTEDNTYRYIFSGSLLGDKLKNNPFSSVSFFDTYQMYPMDFEEFLMAQNISSETLSYLEECFNNKEKIDSSIHEEMMDFFRVYLTIGGLPQIVQTYVNTHNMSLINPLFKAVDQSYKDDIARYQDKHKLLLEDIYNLIPSELNTTNKRFILKDVNKKARFYKYESSFSWFKNSGLGLFAYDVNNPIYPLIDNKEKTLFKLFLCDTGLLSYKLFLGNQIQILNSEREIDIDPLYESYIAQELTAKGFSLYYNNDKKRGELNFLIENDNKIIPIGVKCGTDFKKHKAMTNYMNDPSFNCERGIVFSDSNLFYDSDGVLYLPMYMSLFLK